MAKPKYYISKDNEFVIENYNSAPTFSSFFPGIAGPFGCPMWVFYANRGQCITSAGVRDKNGAILEFQPANKAFRGVSLDGFRTFIKIDGSFYEPFSERSDYQREMRITPDRLKLIEENKKLKLRVEVEYFTVPNESFPALARTLKIINLSAKKRKVEVIDGLPIIIPFGFEDSLLKRISQTIEAWCSVENLENQAPFYKLKVIPSDAAETKYLKAGNFFLSPASRIIVDPRVVFGESSSLELPHNFIENRNFKVPASQLTEGITPSAFACKKAALEARGELEICSLFGHAENVELLNRIKAAVSGQKYFEKKSSENSELISSICAQMKSQSASKALDLYAEQTFLDNVMRGGFPVRLGGKIAYLYYRKHGDMERDYNDFKLMPTYYSLGSGNYRDINQNRRNDIFFNPSVGEDNILRFFNLIQLDGFNPLVVLGTQYYLNSRSAAEFLLNEHIKDPDEKLAKSLTEPFILGELLKKIETGGYRYRTAREEFARELVETAEVEEGASHGEGFWTDHFTYNTDLLESFECLFPEKIEKLLFSEKKFTFYDNDHVVVKRDDKYRLSNGSVRQYGSVRVDVEKSGLLNMRESRQNIVRSGSGQGEIFYTTLIVKLLCLAANKAASFDAEGIGLEMEADKPDWYDALNGLPGLCGSSLSETFELKRLCGYALKHLTAIVKIDLPAELAEFIEKLNGQLEMKDDFQAWDETYKSKETYREKTKLGLSGEMAKVDGKYAADFLARVIARCDRGIQKAAKKYGPYPTYFINEAVEHEPINGHSVRIKKFRQTPLPLFLEGFVHALKVEKDKAIYQQVKNSPLYDKALKMYKVNAPLKSAPVEIGRARIFTPGWLENESVWLHMEYKYLLELLKTGMHREFFAEFKSVLVPFMDPKKYKRSILENSSFIVSSAHHNKANHGRGFVARLSGASAEFIDIWLIMTTGKKIFYLDEKGKLCFKLAPVLPAWLFKGGKFSFNLLGTIGTSYLNSRKNDSFGAAPVSYKLTLEDGKEVEINQSFISEPYSKMIRERKIRSILVKLS